MSTKSTTFQGFHPISRTSIILQGTVINPIKLKGKLTEPTICLSL